jgi:hypothetical protein
MGQTTILNVINQRNAQLTTAMEEFINVVFHGRIPPDVDKKSLVAYTLDTVLSYMADVEDLPVYRPLLFIDKATGQLDYVSYPYNGFLQEIQWEESYAI